MKQPINWPFAMHCVVGASNAAFDVLLKNSVIVFMAFRGDMDAQDLSRLASLAWVLFMAPFFIFSAHGGYLGDHFNKKSLALGLRYADLAIAACTAYGFYTSNLPLLLALVFAKGVTSTLYSPIKYSLVSDLLPRPAHGMGYAVVEAASMAAILCATYLGAMLGANPDRRMIGLVALLIVGMSFLLTVASPGFANASATRTKLGINPIQPTLRILRLATRDRRVSASILALSWYWALGAVFLSNVPVLVRYTLHGDESQIASILLIFTLGVGLGLGGGSWLNQGRMARRLPDAMAALITAMGIDLQFSIPMAPNRMLLDFFLIALASGIYASYFSSALYQAANESEKSRIFAANNIASSLFIVLALAVSTLVLRFEVPIAACLGLFAAATLPITFIARAIFGK
ncbi:permease of the major facilitator superfamily MFS-1 [Rhizobium freirei PRF 81]|uniref:Permease of the major facilitator superfamily MFS-1 n=1 Tax=Rhizobium freirei PRF 81 TaxID=363754 RepID=N6TW36_9HYPH|nr:MFS transporter [Rhizobium freirei]ENN84654.1 permease of the major facilitator superfamily MFS-1 [Rhizobium freirei PRF 81]